MRATRDRFDAQERLRARAADRAAEQRTRNLELAAKRAVARSEANARATRVRLDREFERRERAALARERAAMTRAVRPHAVYRNRW